MHAFIALLSLFASIPQNPLPLEVPEAWKSQTEDGTQTMVPKDLAAGQLHTVLVPTLQRKVGSLEGLIEAGKETLNEIGTFTPLKDPVRGKNDAGWEYDLLIGTIKKGEGSIFAQIVGIQKGKDEGLILLVADSVETWQHYSDDCATMIRTMGRTKPLSGPAAKVDLKFTLPKGWTQKEDTVTTLLEGSTRIDDSVTTVFRVLILPSEPIDAPFRKMYLDLSAAHLKPAIETNLTPLPFMHRLKSGMLCAFDVDDEAKSNNGAPLFGGLYLLARGKRVVPILAFVFNYTRSSELSKAFEGFLESARIPGAGKQAIAPFNAADLVGEWSESSYSMANYATRGGDYAGDASIATAEYMTLNKDGTFKTVFMAVTANRRLKETDAGPWNLEDTALILTGKEKARRYRLFAFGTDPKGGTYLVRSVYSDTDELPDLCRPRQTFSGQWMKKK